MANKPTVTTGKGSNSAKNVAEEAAKKAAAAAAEKAKKEAEEAAKKEAEEAAKKEAEEAAKKEAEEKEKQSQVSAPALDLATLDFASMSAEEIANLFQKVAEAKNAKELEKANELRTFKDAVIKTLNETEEFKSLVSRGISFKVSIDDGFNAIFTFSDEVKEKESNTETGKLGPAPVKYRATDTNGEFGEKGKVYEWTGRGMTPKWVDALLSVKKKSNNDYSLEMFKKDYAV